MLPTLYKDKGECGWWFHLYLDGWWCWPPPTFLGESRWLANFTCYGLPNNIKISSPLEFVLLTGHTFKVPDHEHRRQAKDPRRA